MNTTITPGPAAPSAYGSPPKKRKSTGASIVTGIYLALVLCAPLLVRYAPAVEVQTTATAVQRGGLTHCASSPESDMSCDDAGASARIAR